MKVDNGGPAISVQPRLLPTSNGCFRVVHFSDSDDWKNQFFVEKKGFHLAASMPLSNAHSGLKSPHPLTLLKTTSPVGTCTTRTTPPGGSVKHFAAMLTAKSQSNTKSPETTLVRGSVETMGCELSIRNCGADMVTSHQSNTKTKNHWSSTKSTNLQIRVRFSLFAYSTAAAKGS
jgi:hypothetical protein